MHIADDEQSSPILLCRHERRVEVEYAFLPDKSITISLEWMRFRDEAAGETVDQERKEAGHERSLQERRDALDEVIDREARICLALCERLTQSAHSTTLVPVPVPVASTSFAGMGTEESGTTDGWATILGTLSPSVVGITEGPMRFHRRVVANHLRPLSPRSWGDTDTALQ